MRTGSRDDGGWIGARGWKNRIRPARPCNGGVGTGLMMFFEQASRGRRNMPRGR